MNLTLSTSARLFKIISPVILIGRKVICILVMFLTTTYAAPLYAQDQDTTAKDSSFKFRMGVDWLELNGEVRLVRGSRKVVTTDAGSGISWGGQVEFIPGGRFGFFLEFTQLASDYTHNEDFTNGLSISTTDDLKLNMIQVGFNRYYWQDRKIDFFAGVHFSYVMYSKKLNLFSEQMPLPADLSTINPTPFNLEVHNGPGIGIHLGIIIPLNQNWFISTGSSLSLAWMRADIIDDPEDPESGSDINSPFHPLKVGIKIGYRY